MVESSRVAHAQAEGGEPIGALDTIGYIQALCEEMAAMAGAQGLTPLAAALDLSRALAREALEAAVRQASSVAAPDDAT